MDEPTAEAMSLTVSVCAGLKQFIGDMGTTHRPIAVWASLFPFPQIFVGGFLAATRGVASPAALVFVTRVASFFIAGQVRALTYAGGGCGLQLQCVARMSCGSTDQHQGPALAAEDA